MSDLVELLAGTPLAMNLSEGVKFFAESKNGQMIAMGSRSGSIGYYQPGSENIEYVNLQPTKRKTNSEAELQGLWLSESGDVLYVATSVDIVALNTSTKTVAWEYQQKRQWGFLASIPQCGYLGPDDELTIFYSSGEVVQLDRKARVLFSKEYGQSPKLIADNRLSRLVFGSDGHVVWKWDRIEGFESRECVLKQPCYDLKLSTKNEVLAIRSMNRQHFFDANSLAETESYHCEAGLPTFTINKPGNLVCHLNGSKVTIKEWSGEIVGLFEAYGDFPVSVHTCNCLESILVGMRSGTTYRIWWPE